MSHRFGGVLFLSVIAAVLSKVASPAADPAPQKGGDKTVFAAVVEASGRPSRDLSNTDWGVREDGRDREVIAARPATDPMAITLLADTTAGTRDSITDVRRGLAAFVRAVLSASPTSTISIISVSGNPLVISDFSSRVADFDKAIPKLYQDQSMAGVMLESIVDAAKRLATASTPRRQIVAINLEGFPEGSGVTPQNVANAVWNSHASLWAVSYRNGASNTVSAGGGAGAAGSSPAGLNRDLILTNLTRDTGGARLTVGVSSAVEVSLVQVANVLLSQYAVTYARPEGTSPKTLRVVNNRPGAYVLVTAVPPR